MALIITLIIVGILLIVAEILIIPGIFVAGLLGLGALVGSCVIAFEEYGQIGGLIVIVINCLLLITFTIISLRSNTWKKISLSTKIGDSVDLKVEEKGLSEGDVGQTISRLNPIGKAIFKGLTVEVNARNEMIKQGETVEISQIEGNTIFVKTKK